MRKIGQKVSWIDVKQDQHLTLALKQGIIISIEEPIAMIYKGKGNTEKVELFRLRTPKGERQMNEVAEALVEGLK